MIDIQKHPYLSI